MNARSGQASALYVKRHGARTGTDWRRVVLFATLVNQVEGFATAAPVCRDEAAGTISYERLPAVRALMRPPPAADVFARLGCLLARLHASALPVDLAGSPVTPYPLADSGLTPSDIRLLDARLPCGFFWGDCWHGNIFLHGDGRFFVIDPLPHEWLFDAAHLTGNGALDLALLHMSLFFSHPLLRLACLDVRALVPLGQALLEGYLAEADAMPVLPVVGKLSRLLAGRYVAAYRARLLWPIAIGKQKLSARIMSGLDTEKDEAI